MSDAISELGSSSASTRIHSTPSLRSLRLSGESFNADKFAGMVQGPPRWRGEFLEDVVDGIKRRWQRERRRRKVGRAYDMALEITRVIPRGSEVLDVGCGNGFIAHHLSAILGADVVGVDLGSSTEAPIDYRQYDGSRFPAPDNSFNAVLLCYVLHHTQDVSIMLNEMRRVLRDGGLAIVYEDIPRTWWDKGVCWMHNQQWRRRTGSCSFRREPEWCSLFESFGFEIVSERSLSRWRNLTHPVARKFFVLRKSPIHRACPPIS